MTMKHILNADTSLPPVVVDRSEALPVHGISPFSGQQAAGYYDPPHTHDRGQFSYRTEGFAMVKAAGRNIFLSPGRGVWIPAGVVHEVACRGPAAYNAFYVDAAIAPQPTDVRVIAVSPLLDALVGDMMSGKGRDDPDRSRLITNLILDELLRSPDLGSTAPIMPRAPGLRELCDQLSRNPGQLLDIDACSSAAGMSRRNFTRQFRNETGMSAGEWYQQLRMYFADAWLEQGLSLKIIAFRLGYSNTASFSRAYERSFQCPPKARG